MRKTIDALVVGVAMVLLAWLGISIQSNLAETSKSETATTMENCLILSNSYFSEVPTSDKLDDPRGYFDEVVAQQENFVAAIDLLNTNDQQEQLLISKMATSNRELLDIYIVEQLKIEPGSSAYEYQTGMTQAESESWQARGKVASVKTKEATEAIDSFAEFCSH